MTSTADRNQPPPIAERPPGGGPLGNLLVGLFLLVVFGLGIRGLATDDSQFSWGMFGRQCEFLVIAYWVYPDGKLEAHFPGDELDGRSSFMRPHRRGRATRVTRHALGTVRGWCIGYGEYLYQNQRPQGVVAVQIEFSYAIGKPLQGARDFITEDIFIPAEPRTKTQ